MQIYCPKCNAGYLIDDKLIEDKSRRLKCSSCGEIFNVDSLNKNPSDQSLGQLEQEEPFEMLSAIMAEENEAFGKESVVGQETEPPEQEIADSVAEVPNLETEKPAEEILQNFDKADQNITEATENPEKEDAEEEKAEEEIAEDENVDLESIFERLSEHTEHLIEQEKKLPFYEKAWLQVKNILGFHFKIKWNYIFAGVAVFALFSLYNNRYQIVREVPFLNSVYKAFGIQAKIPGEGLEFQNISWDFITDEEGSRLEVKGFINNLSNKNIDLPIIHIEILDKETVMLQSQNREIEEEGVEAHTKIPLNLVIENPAPTAKYVYLTFIEKN